MGFTGVGNVSTVTPTRYGLIDVDASTVTGAGQFRASGLVADVSGLTFRPALEIQAGDIVTALYAAGAVRRIATYEVTAIVSRVANRLTFDAVSLDSPQTLFLPRGRATIGETVEGYLSLVTGEPDELRAEKLNNLLANLPTPGQGGGVDWELVQW